MTRTHYKTLVECEWLGQWDLGALILALAACGSIGGTGAAVDPASPSDLTQDAGTPTDAGAEACATSEPVACIPDAAALPLYPTPLSSATTYHHRVNVIVEGDSLDAEPYEPLPDGGVRGPAPAIWVPVLAAMIGTNFQFRDVAIGGMPCAWLRSTYAQRVKPLYEPGTPVNMVVVECGVPDIVAAGKGLDGGDIATMAPIVDDAFAYAREMRADGFVVEFPTPSASQYFQHAGYQYYRQRVLTECNTFADSCPDLAADPRLNEQVFATIEGQLTWFVDSTHQNQNGGMARAGDLLQPTADAAQAKLFAIDAGGLP